MGLGDASMLDQICVLKDFGATISQRRESYSCKTVITTKESGEMIDFQELEQSGWQTETSTKASGKSISHIGTEKCSTGMAASITVSGSWA